MTARIALHVGPGAALLLVLTLGAAAAQTCAPGAACLACAGREPGTGCSLFAACTTGTCDAAAKCQPLVGAPCAGGGTCDAGGGCGPPPTTTTSTTLPPTAANPGALLVYYGFPGSLNYPSNGFVPANVAADLAQYDYVVLGDEVEFGPPADCDCSGMTPVGTDCHLSNFGNQCGHPDYAATTAILGDPVLAGTRIFGYVDLGVGTQDLAPAEIERRVDLWAGLGVAGVFFDDFGYDFCVTRARQNAAVTHAHSQGLAVIANAFVPADAFGTAGGDACGTPANPGGVAPALDAGDYYFFESHQVRLGSFVDGPTWQAKAEAVEALQQAIPFGVLSITTNAATDAYDQDAFFYAWYSAAMYGHAATGWGEHRFSAQDPVNALAPYRDRPAVAVGATLVGDTVPAAPDAALYCRATDAGAITVDVTAHTAGFTPAGTCGGATTTSTSTTSTTSSSSTTSTAPVPATTTTTTVLPPTTTPEPVATTTTTTTAPVPATSTTIRQAVEVCGNCLDDDGDGRVDFEDPACCGGAVPGALSLRKARLRPEDAGGLPRTRLRLQAVLKGLTLADTDDVHVQLLPAGATAWFCARLPAATFDDLRRGRRFDDDATPSSRGIEGLRLRPRKKGRVVVTLRGDAVELPLPDPGPIAIVLGFRDPGGDERGNQCRAATAVLRASRHGTRRHR